MTTDRLLLRPWTGAEAAAVRAGDRRPDWAGDFVVERATRLVVGSIGLFWPPEDGVVEIGYGIVPSRHGRRYAAEATVALTGFALTSPDVRSVSAQVERSNPASVRVLEAAGFTLVADEGEVLRFSRS
ncbi:GNAT family N-acetyltransferase [Amycolatopsis sp. 3B14]|uniref:GNAT family N-acetyltransferase n=1 Tax=Amycolatopsis sp. 3B14 TaxID=3243600 RepID=UPI003D989988